MEAQGNENDGTQGGNGYAKEVQALNLIESIQRTVVKIRARAEQSRTLTPKSE